MSKMEDLIARLSPNGVEMKCLKDMAEIGTGSSNRIDSDEGGKYPFYVRSKEILRSNKYLYD